MKAISPSVMRQILEELIAAHYQDDGIKPLQAADIGMYTTQVLYDNGMITEKDYNKINGYDED